MTSVLTRDTSGITKEKQQNRSKISGKKRAWLRERSLRSKPNKSSEYYPEAATRKYRTDKQSSVGFSWYNNIVL